MNFSNDIRELLVQVPSIGHKTVDKLFQELSPLGALRRIVEGEDDVLSSVAGIGQKTADKLCKTLHVRGTILFEDLRSEAEGMVRDALRSGGEEAAQMLVEEMGELLAVFSERPTFEMVTEDKEVEHFFQVPRFYWEEDEEGFPTVQKMVWESYPTWINNNTKYLTYSGNPGEADAQLDRTAAGFDPMDLVDLPGSVFTSTWGYQDKACSRNFHQFVTWIWLNQENKVKLQAGLARFWKRYFLLKEKGGLNKWLTPKQVDMIRGTFKKFGILSKAEQRLASNK